MYIYVHSIWHRWNLGRVVALKSMFRPRPSLYPQPMDYVHSPKFCAVLHWVPSVYMREGWEWLRCDRKTSLGLLHRVFRMHQLSLHGRLFLTAPPPLVRLLISFRPFSSRSARGMSERLCWPLCSPLQHTDCLHHIQAAGGRGTMETADMPGPLPSSPPRSPP